jgi:hypothetical protein
MTKQVSSFKGWMVDWEMRERDPTSYSPVWETKKGLLGCIGKLAPDEKLVRVEVRVVPKRRAKRT